MADDEKKKGGFVLGDISPIMNQSPERRREVARKAAVASNQVQAHRRQLRAAAQALLWHPLSKVPEEQEIVLTLAEMGVEDPTGADAVMLAQYVKARRGDTEAARFLRDTAGEKPSQQVELNLLDKPIDAIDFSTLDDAQLAELARARNMSLIAGEIIDAGLLDEEPVPGEVETRRPEKLPEHDLSMRPWPEDGEINFQKELTRPPKKKPGPPKGKPVVGQPDLDKMTKKEREEYDKALAEWKAQREPVLAAKRKARAEQKAKEEAEYKAALEERFGKHNTGDNSE